MNCITILSFIQDNFYRFGRFICKTFEWLGEEDQARILGNIVTVLYAAIRFILLTVNTIYSISAHCIWILLLTPLQRINNDLFWTIENTMYEWLLSLIGFWIYGSTHYDIIEMGDSLEICGRGPGSSLILVNHQSTADVPLLMTAFQAKKCIARYMWIMDWIFRYTHFGIVSWLHRDFFILSGFSRREEAKQLLKNHIINEFMPTNKQFIILFPEGGFHRKRKHKSKEYALQHNIANTVCNVSLPRTGAFCTLVNVLRGKECFVEGNRQLKWVIDITVAYENGVPLDFQTYISLFRDPCTTYIFYRVYEATEVPQGENEMINWLYNLWETKEKILNLLYARKMPLKLSAYHNKKKGDLIQPTEVKVNFTKIILINIFHATSTYVHYRFIWYIISFIWYIIAFIWS